MLFVVMIISVAFQCVTRKFLSCSQRRLEYALFVGCDFRKKLEFVFMKKSEFSNSFELTTARGCDLINFLKPRVMLSADDNSPSSAYAAEVQLVSNCLKKRRFFENNF
jgi:hypothetical protein